MKRLVIILTLAIILFTTPIQDADQLPVTDPEMSQTAVTEQTEEMPANDTEKVDVGKTEEITKTNGEPIPTENEETTEERPVVQETPVKTEEMKESEAKKTVECVDSGDQTLVEYKPQSVGQPNPFENASLADIVDHPVDELISEGEDRPGEGKHF